MILKLAWRNIWRSKRRSLITISSIVIAVLFSVLLSSIRKGTYESLIGNLIRMSSGYVQIQSNIYFDEPSVDNAMLYDENVQDQIKSNPLVKQLLPRISNGALVANENISVLAMVQAVDGAIEQKYGEILKGLNEGEIFKKGSNQIVIAKKLSEKLNKGVGDTIAFIGAGMYGSSANALLPISGIVNLSDPNLSRKGVFMDISFAQEFFEMPNLVTGVMVDIEDIDDAEQVAEDLNKQLGESYNVMPWKELLADMIEIFEQDKAEGYIQMGILYMIIAFGMFGTVLMMLNERVFEFGVMLSLGVQKYKIIVMMFLEIWTLSLLGVIAGSIIASPIVYFMHLNPIYMGGDLEDMYAEYGMEPYLNTAFSSEVFMQQAYIISIIALVISLYPVLKIIKLNPVKAMRR